MIRYLVASLLLVKVGFAQQTQIPRDTSFTVYSAFQKESKSRPYIKIAEPKLPDGVKVLEGVEFARAGNRPLLMDVFYPAKKSKTGYPAVVFVFGGGWRSGDRSMSIPMAQQVAAQGFVTAAVDYRLSLEAQYPAAVHDVKAAIRYLRAHAAEFAVDKSKIAIHGVSAGGQLAALVGTTNGLAKLEGDLGNIKESSAVQAIIDVDGVLAFKHPESAEGAVAAQWLGGTYEEKPEIWDEASALHHVNKNTPPILFINSSLPRFHAGRNDMIRKMDSLGIYSEVHTFPDTPHPFWLFHPWFNDTVKFTVEFLNKVFKQQ